MLEHGGRLRAAAQRFNIPLADWLDLSTGINPQVYPVPPLVPSDWQRLPEDDDGLEAAAAAYYGNSRLLALPGSQAAISRLPALFPPATLACLTPLYEEHPQAWARAGHKLRRFPDAALGRALSAATPLLLLCNPNNPTGQRFSRATLLDAARQLGQRGGWLIVDEAFGDCAPQECLAPFAGTPEAPRLIVLRSLGKFFGLAGARVGFIFGAPEKLEPLREMLGPWPLSGPARAAARYALSDRDWQAGNRQELIAAGQALAQRLSGLAGLHGAGKVSGIGTNELFVSLRFAEKGADGNLCDHLARRAILVRHFPEHGLLRFGLPGQASEWKRLDQALDEWRT